MSDVQSDTQENAPVTAPEPGLETGGHTPATLVQPDDAAASGSPAIAVSALVPAYVRDELDAIRFLIVSGTGTALDRLGSLMRYIEARM